MILAYAAKLDFNPQKASIGAQNIDNSIFKTYEMVLAKFLI